MAPINQKTEKKTFARKEGNGKNSKNAAVGVKKKRKWVPEHKKFFEGSVKEGQGFAFQRKQMVRYEYNKLKRKQEKNKTTQALYKEEYPEHLRHLYEAEAQKLKKEAWENRVKRSKKRMMGREEAQEDEVVEDEAAAPWTAAAAPTPKADTPQTTAAAPSPKDAAQPPAAGPQSEDTDGSELTEKPEAETQRESLPMSNRMKKKLQKKTSYQKTKEEYEEVKEKKTKKKEEFLKNKKQREEAIAKYKQKKMETFQMLSKKTKRGQPNLNLQMDYLLQKIQKTQP